MELLKQSKESHPAGPGEASDKERTGRCKQLFQPQRQMCAGKACLAEMERQWVGGEG